ncbi:MAG: hypothetical protein EDX89_24495, partial [Acidobacteria bacterium]
FLQEDPIPAVSLYAYALNAPLAYTDPSGLVPDGGGIWDSVESFFRGVFTFPSRVTRADDSAAQAVADPAVGNSAMQTQRVIDPGHAFKEGATDALTTLSTQLTKAASEQLAFATVGGVLVRSGQLRFCGLAKRRPLRELTHAELVRAFAAEGFTLSNHAIMRLKDPRTAALGFHTLTDVASIMNRGTVASAGEGMVEVTYRGMQFIVDVARSHIITLRPQ